jgi:hypothetical protein
MDFNFYIQNLDSKTITLYFLGFCFLFICFNNFFVLSTHSFFALVITIFILYIFYRNNYYNLSNNLDQIKKNNKLLNLDSFPNILKDVNFIEIFEKLKTYGKFNKYDFLESISACEQVLINYKKLLEPCDDYKQIIDLAEENRDSALNHLQVITNSIQPTTVILKGNKYITDIDNFHSLITDLSELLNNYIFDMYRLAKTYYDTNDINVYSYPITYDNEDPAPLDETKMVHNFDIYYGTARP